MDSRLASFPEVLNVETSPMAKDQASAGQTNMGFSSKHCLVDSDSSPQLLYWDVHITNFCKIKNKDKVAFHRFNINCLHDSHLGPITGNICKHSSIQSNVSKLLLFFKIPNFQSFKLVLIYTQQKGIC